MNNFPTTLTQLLKEGEPVLSTSFLYLNHVTREELLHFYWYSVAKPAIMKSGSFDQKGFNLLYNQCLRKYFGRFGEEPSLSYKLMALREARDLFEAPAKKESGTRLLRDCFDHDKGIWG
tara:strand:+ start:263 stop:619 length:357 start_codon:yes stop_codon:yes gene_type:complete